MARSREKVNVSFRTHQNQVLQAKKRKFVSLVEGLLGKKSNVAVYFVKNFKVHAFQDGSPHSGSTHYTVKHTLTKKAVTIRTEDPVAILTEIVKLLARAGQERQRLQSLMQRQAESEERVAEQIAQAIGIQKERTYRKQKTATDT